VIWVTFFAIYNSCFINLALCTSPKCSNNQLIMI